MTALSRDIAAFEGMRKRLEADHFGQWVVFQGGVFVAVYADFETAAGEAVDRFDAGPYLIRQVGARQSNCLAAWSSHPHTPLVQVGIRKGSGDNSRADIFVKVGPTLRVDIGLKSRSDFGERPDLPMKRVLALIDTGPAATVSTMPSPARWDYP